jgi:hypothetical protein
MANAILDAALDYAKHGIPVFPVNPLDKALRTWLQGCHDQCIADRNLVAT